MTMTAVEHASEQGYKQHVEHSRRLSTCSSILVNTHDAVALLYCRRAAALGPTSRKPTSEVNTIIVVWVTRKRRRHTKQSQFNSREVKKKVDASLQDTSQRQPSTLSCNSTAAVHPPKKCHHTLRSSPFGVQAHQPPNRCRLRT